MTSTVPLLLILLALYSSPVRGDSKAAYALWETPGMIRISCPFPLFRIQALENFGGCASIVGNCEPSCLISAVWSSDASCSHRLPRTSIWKNGNRPDGHERVLKSELFFGIFIINLEDIRAVACPTIHLERSTPSRVLAEFWERCFQ